MNFEMRNTICDLEIIKEKLDDVVVAHSYFGDDMFAFRDRPKGQQAAYYVAGYDESRIHHEQTTDLLTMYLKQFDDLIKKFHEIEKNALSHADQSEDNA